MSETIKLEDMRLFAKVAELKSFTNAARKLEVPKQTLSRRVAALERALGVRLIHRTTRRLQLSDAGAVYAERCAEIVRLGEEANRAVSDTSDVPTGTLRITADPVFGEAFLTPLVIDYARKWPEVRVDVVLTRRHVDLLEEGFDLAFRIGNVDDPLLSARKLGAARVRYCASPRYVARRGAPRTPEELPSHDCVLVGSDQRAVRWPFPAERGPRLLPVSGRLVFSSFTMAREAVLAGLGIAIFPEFACAEDLRRRRLTPVLDGCVVDVGSVWLIHLARRFLPARVRAFVDLARDHFVSEPPWLRAGKVKKPA
ncbi:MAG: LysR family transcriptional regulator [Polyangiaceae bacterium]|nr:LysR family transcriptional regulator [Polyangiaceae bacterium]